MAIVHIVIVFFCFMVALSKILQASIWILTHEKLPRRGKFITFIILAFITVATFVAFMIACVVIIETGFALQNMK